MDDGEEIGVGEEPYVKVCQCTACDTDFEKRSRDIVETAQEAVNHWNSEHPDILTQSFPAFREAEQERHELENGICQIRTQRQYLTVYDVLNPDDEEAIFDPAFVENVILNEVCEDCETSIEELDDYEKLSSHGPVPTYLCEECRKERKIRRRKLNNRQLSAFERA